MQIGLIGCGNMGRALARGWRRPLLCADPIAERARALADEVSGEALQSNLEVARGSDLLVLAHKPSQLGEVAAEVGGEAVELGVYVVYHECPVSDAVAICIERDILSARRNVLYQLNMMPIQENDRIHKEILIALGFLHGLY